MKNNVSKSSEMFPCEQPPRDSYVPPPPPSDEQLRRLAPDLNKVTSFAHVMLLGDQKTPILAKQPVWKSREMLRLVGLVEKYLVPEPAMRCDMCGQCQESVRPRRVSTVGKNSGTVRTKFCDECAAVVTKWLKGEETIQSPPEDTVTVATEEPLTPAQVEQVTQSLVEGEAERDLPRLVEKYRAIEKQSGKRVQVCIADYDETTYNFLHLGTGWTHGFWRMINHATARKLREQGFLVRFVSLDLDDYMAWLARENLHDSSTARAQFAAAIADSEMGLKSAVPAPGSEPSGETSKRLAPADMRCDIRKRDRWMRLAKTTIITLAVAALAGFVGGYNSRAPNHLAEMAVARSPEIRRAIPVEREIRKAIPVQTRAPGGRPGPRVCNTTRDRQPAHLKNSRFVIQRKASK